MASKGIELLGLHMPFPESIFLEMAYTSVILSHNVSYARGGEDRIMENLRKRFLPHPGEDKTNEAQLYQIYIARIQTKGEISSMISGSAWQEAKKRTMKRVYIFFIIA